MSKLILPRRLRPPNDQRGFIINPYAFAGAPPASLPALILAKNPIIYWRHNEASGTAMADSSPNGRNGTYQTSGGSPIPQSAIYTGGPTCMEATSNGRFGFYGGMPPALNNLTILTIFRPNSVTGLHSLVCRDENSNRKWLWIMNGASLDFYKIVGSIETTSAASVFAIGTTVLIAVTVSAAGAVALYKSSPTTATPIQTATFSPANYGGSGDTITVGYAVGAGAAANGFFSETAIFDSVLAGADIAAIATAAGL